MTEQELMHIIQDIEQEDIHQAPEYLKEIILRKAENVKQTEIVEKRTNAVLSLKMPKTPSDRSKDRYQLENNNTSPKVQFFLYSLKAVAATAAALFLVFTVPPLQESARASEHIEWQQQRELDRQKMEEQLLAEKERISITAILNEGTGRICSQLAKITDNLWEKENR